eukprot:COSAG06_NODE_62701_length_257_cov_0.696970_1_plen_27_part_10
MEHLPRTRTLPLAALPLVHNRGSEIMI